MIGMLVAITHAEAARLVLDSLRLAHDVYEARVARRREEERQHALETRLAALEAAHAKRGQ